MTEVVAPRGRGSRIRRAFMPSQRDGWVLVSLVAPGLTLMARDDGTWSVVGGAAIVVLVAAGIVTLVWSGRRAADGDAFWRAVPRAAAVLLLL
ncbi:hypothetical protein [Xylanimonas sp. McL0601]|uniref:hypothetical protein n=1 Tax=Xylanimonas sp. McL0601 TaxID=3414739 RepID=UPI003CF5469F